MRNIKLPVRMTERDKSYLLGAFAGCDARTALSWLRDDGQKIRRNTLERLEASAEALGFEQAKAEGRAA